MTDHTQEIEALLAQMTLEEKASLCSGADEWTTKPVARLGIPSIWLSDGPHGLRRSPDSRTGGFGDQIPATCYPTASALAATWDVDLLGEVGEHLGTESRSLGVHVLLGPGINVKRSPLGGRNFEYFSEDPTLAGELGAAYIQGVQRQGVGTSLKHFACNSQETRRMVADSVIDERTLREIYLRNFEIAVTKGRPWTVMASYNPVNGTDATANEQLLTSILRKEWGFAGTVISDWVSVFDRVAGVRAGLDIEMPGNKGFNDKKIVDAVKKGTLDERELDAAVRHVLALVFRAKDGEKAAPRNTDTAHHEFARKVAAEAIVLLKNEGGLLPVDAKRHRTVAIIGEFARTPRFQGNGSSEIHPTKIDTLLAEFTALAGPDIRVTYAPGYELSGRENPELLEEAVRIARDADIALVHAGLPSQLESEGVDREHINLPADQNALIEAIARVQPNTTVILTNGTAIAMPWAERVPAILETWLAGQAGAGAIADVLFGRVNPSGKLAETFPAREEDTPSFLDLPSKNLTLRYGEGIFAGYRWYEKRKIAPLFPFGHGLSYTAFEYSAIWVSATAIRGEEPLGIRLRVRNTGGIKGKEVVQIYVRDIASSLPRPVKELRAFAKVALEPGEEKEVSFTLTRRDFSFFDPECGEWIAETGDFEILAGSSSADIRLSATFRYEAAQTIHPDFTERTVLRDWIKYPETRGLTLALVKPYFDCVPGLCQGPYEDFNVTNSFFVDMPIIKYARLSGGAISETAIREFVKTARSLEIHI